MCRGQFKVLGTDSLDVLQAFDRIKGQHDWIFQIAILIQIRKWPKRRNFFINVGIIRIRLCGLPFFGNCLEVVIRALTEAVDLVIIRMIIGLSGSQTNWGSQGDQLLHPIFFETIGYREKDYD